MTVHVHPLVLFGHWLRPLAPANALGDLVTADYPS
jgi:hypothetical protein